MGEDNVWNNDGDSTDTGGPIVIEGDGSGDPNPPGPDAIVNDVSSEDSAVRLLAVKSAVTLINSGTIEELIEAGIVPKLVNCLTDYDDPTLQCYALRALALLGSGRRGRVRAIVEAGALPHFVDLLCSPHSSVREQAKWAISFAVWRWAEEEMDVLMTLSNLIAAGSQSEILRWIYTETDLYICCGDPFRLKVAPILLRQLQETDDETLRSAVSSTSLFVHGNIDSIEVTIITQFISHLVPLLSNSNFDVKAGALRALANIVGGSGQHTQAVLETGILNEFPRLLTSEDWKILTGALSFLCSLTLGKQRHIQTLINHDLVPLIILALDEPNILAKEGALSLIINFALYGNAEQVQYLAEHGVIPPLCRILNENSGEYYESALQCILRILTHAENRLEEIKIQMRECGGIDALEVLQEHEDMTIFRLAYHIMEQFFG